MWEGGLPPMAVGQSITYWLILPHRGQAPSHIWSYAVCRKVETFR